ncbi:MAG: NAD(+) synthase [Myxococcota bacterium]
MPEPDLFNELLRRKQQAEKRLAEARALEHQWRQLTCRTDERALELIAKWLAAQVKAIGAQGCVFGLSGGVDSSLVAVLLARSGVENIIAYSMPCGSPPKDQEDAVELCRVLRLSHRVLDLRPAARALFSLGGVTFEEADPLLRGNLASRLRHTLLYLEANRHGLLVVGTGDLDEAYVGYGTKGSTADLFPITGLHKDEVRQLLRLALTPIDAGLAERFAQRPASPGYFEGQLAESELGIDYSALGPLVDVLREHCVPSVTGLFPKNPSELEAMVQARGLSVTRLLHVAELARRNHHKVFGSPSLDRPFTVE